MDPTASSELVLLTGSTGFIGAYILKYLLEQGYSVLAVVRAKEQGSALLSAYPRGVSFAIVEDITAPGAYDKVLQEAGPVKSVIHAASPFFFGHSDPESEILLPSIRGVVEILTSIHKYAPTVQRVVLTSSLAAMLGDPAAQGPLNESHWNPITFEGALQPELTYIGSKALAEKAAWEFVSSTPDVGFSLVSINPGMVFGPPLRPPGRGKAINFSNSVTHGLIHGSFKDGVPATQVPWWVDVREVAHAHIQALTVKGEACERFVLFGGLYTFDQVVQIISDKFPELRESLPTVDASDPLKTGSASPPQFDNSKSVRLLGIDYRSLEDSVASTVPSLIPVSSV